MIEREIAPRYMMYFITFTLVCGLVAISFIYSEIVNSFNLQAMIIFGFFFILIVIVNLLWVRYGVYINELVGQEGLQIGGLLTQQVVLLSSFEKPRKLYSDIYTLRISGKRYVFFAFAGGIEHLNKLLDGNSN